MDNKKYNLLSRKKEILAEILRLTRYSPIYVSENAPSEEMDKACEEIIFLYEKRAKLFAEMEDIDAQLSQLPEGASTDELLMLDDIKRLSAEIFNFDTDNVKLLERLQAHIKNSIKTINVGKRTREYSTH